jgi:hypothetical protein
VKRAPDVSEKEDCKIVPIEGWPNAVTFKRKPVEPVPVGTYIAMVFRVTGYDPDCDGSLMARFEHVDEQGEATGWEPKNLGLYPTTDIVLDDAGELFRLADEQGNDEPGYHGTMQMSAADANEVASWAKDQVVRERMALLETAVRRIADTDTHGKNVRDESGTMRPTGQDFCGRCNRNSFHPHADDCPIMLAVRLCV